MEKYVEFYNGIKMPRVGLGTWQANDPDQLEAALEEALTVGYRHFDTAFLYQNENVIGNVLKRWLDAGKVQRKDLFITTKLPPTGMRPMHVPHYLKKSLENLQLDYVDLYLIHIPIGFTYVSDMELFPMKDGKLCLDTSTDHVSIWKAMENQVDGGLTRSIGLSNFSQNQIKRIVKCARIPPSNLQVEVHAAFQQSELIEFCKKLNISVCAYSPLGSPGKSGEFEEDGITIEKINLMEDPIVLEVASEIGKTPAQILLRHLVEKNVVVIPKSIHAERVRENFQIFDFELNDKQMKCLDALDRGEAGRMFSGGAPGLTEHPEYGA